MPEPSEKTPISRSLPETPQSEIPAHVMIRNRLRAPVLQMYPEALSPQTFAQSVLEIWGKDEFFQGKADDLGSIKRDLASGVEATTKLLAIKPHNVQSLQQHGISTADFMKTSAASQLVYLSERAMLKHLVYGGVLPESKTTTVAIKNASIIVDAFAAGILDSTSELQTQAGVEYIFDSDEGRKIAQSLLTIFQASGQHDNLMKARHIFTLKGHLGLGSTDRQTHRIIIGLATRADRPATWETKLTTALVASAHELTHIGQDIDLPNLLAELDAFTSQDILANGACDLVHAGKITEDDNRFSLKRMSCKEFF